MENSTITTNEQDSKGVLLSAIRETLLQARKNISRNVNTIMVHAYWQVGKHIVEYEQGGERRASMANRYLKICRPN